MSQLLVFLNFLNFDFFFKFLNFFLKNIYVTCHVCSVPRVNTCVKLLYESQFRPHIY